MYKRNNNLTISALNGYAICYPQIKHPLDFEKEDLKKKYLSLLNFYVDKFCPNDNVMMYRVATLTRILLREQEADMFIIDLNNLKKVAGEIGKTKFTPFRLFSYRYLFLFDCIFLLAADNEILGKTIVEDFKKLVNRKYHKTLETMVEKMYDGDDRFAAAKLISADMVSAWNSTRSYARSINRNITFTSTMSAGKSTLINAIIGKELSYAQKAACTATIMKFKTSPAKVDLLNVTYNNEIVQLLKEQDVREFTKEREEPCEIYSYFSSLLSSKKITLIDTPGVNYSQDPRHKKITRSELTRENTDILVYIIPVENYGSEDDFEHLMYIKKKVQYKNIVFVVNMMDTCDLEDDSVSEIVKNVTEHLESLGYENPIICPMSAKAGMLIKQALIGTKPLSENDKKACKTYIDIFSEDELSLNKFYPEVKKNNILNDISWLKMDKEAVWSAYSNTGLSGFEKLLYNIIEESM